MKSIVRIWYKLWCINACKVKLVGLYFSIVIHIQQFLIDHYDISRILICCKCIMWIQIFVIFKVKTTFSVRFRILQEKVFIEYFARYVSIKNIIIMRIEKTSQTAMTIWKNSQKIIVCLANKILFVCQMRIVKFHEYMQEMNLKNEITR